MPAPKHNFIGMLVPPDNFGLVEPGVYRSSKLEADHIPFIETLQLRLLVLLDAAKPPRTLRGFLEEKKVELFNLGGLKISLHSHGYGGSSKDSERTEPPLPQRLPRLDLEPILLDKKSSSDSWMLIESNMVAGAFEVLLNKTKHPTLVVDSSLTLVGILRKIQKWNFNSIVNEFRIYTGDSSKNNYNAQNFFELIQLELVPYEVDQCLRRRDDVSRRGSNRHSLPQLAILSVDDTAILSPAVVDDEEDEEHNSVASDDGGSLPLSDLEDELDEEMLLASPQIPANLLKLVEQRKHDDKNDINEINDINDINDKSSDSTPLHSPVASSADLSKCLNAHRHASVAANDLAHLAYPPAVPQRRKSSADSRFLRSATSRLRYPSFSGLSLSPGRRPSLESSLRLFKFNHDRASAAEALQKAKDRCNFRYYKSLDPVPMKGIKVLKLRLPPEEKLPDWFINGRNYWENLTDDH